MRKTVALVYNSDSQRVGLVAYQANVLGDPKIYFYLINRKKYQWAADEGFSLEEMVELEQEGIFTRVDPDKIAQYLM